MIRYIVTITKLNGAKVESVETFSLSPTSIQPILRATNEHRHHGEDNPNGNYLYLSSHSHRPHT